MGRRFCASLPLHTSSSLPSVAELQSFSPSPTSQASIPQLVAESLTRTYDGSLVQSLKKLRHHNFVITEPNFRHGHLVVYASDGFLQMTGYLAEEVMGRNPKFLQGPDTDRRSVLLIRDSVSQERPCTVTLLNYTKQGWPFWVLFHMAPVFSPADGRLMHFVSAQIPLSECFFGLVKQGLICDAASVVPSHKDALVLSIALLEQKIENAGHFRSSPCFKGQWLTGTGLNGSCDGQKKKKMKVALTVVQLVVHELTISSKRKNAEAVHTRRLSENADTALCSSLTLALTRIQQSFVISNPCLPGMPVIYASDMFLGLTGYSKEEVLGRNCRFLQGQETDTGVVQQMGDCIRTERACTVRILNYRKDKAAFWNLLHVAPVRDHTGKVACFVGVQVDLGASKAECCLRQESGMAPVMQQLGAVGAVKVVVRGLQGRGLCRNLRLS
uniref:Putative LOV domain-containing protein n=1 Tax=Lonchitis hirsuta TaxID=32095 RepID=A0A126X2Y7_LONHI|nr:putative LOV domain-containing protein [Lonchitis hirsuta]